MDSEKIETLPAVADAMADVNALARFEASYSVVTSDQYLAGGEDLKRVKAAQKKLEDSRTSITSPMNAALKRVNDFFRSPAEKLATIERTIKRGMVAYSDEQDRIRREEQRKAEEIARRERDRAEQAARDERAKAEARAADLRRQAEAAAAAGHAEEAAKAAAKAAAVVEKAEAKADAMEVQAAQVVAPIIQREAPKVSGVSTREVWKFEVVDAAKIPREYLAIDETKLRKVVGAMKGDAVIPGVRIYSERVMASGSAA